MGPRRVWTLLAAVVLQYSRVLSAHIDCTQGTNALRTGCPASPPSAECEPAVFVANVKLSCPLLKNHYFEKTPGTWELARDIKCNQQSGAWEELTTGNVLTPGTNVVCAAKDPTPSCDKSARLHSDCTFATIDETASCSQVPFLHDDSTKSCKPGKLLYYFDGSMWQAVSDNQISCELTTGLWKQGTTIVTPFSGTEVICADRDPNADVCLTFDTTCDAGWDTAFGCEAPGNSIYGVTCRHHMLFLRKKPKPGQIVKFRVVGVLSCRRKQVIYSNGLYKTELIDFNDRIICANENPDKDVCITGMIPNSDEILYKIIYPWQTNKYEAGELAKDCDGERGEEFVGQDLVTRADSTTLANGVRPQCQQDGTWKLGEDVNMGSKIMCRIRICNTHTSVPSAFTSPSPLMVNSGANLKFHVGVCGVAECESGGKKLVMRTADGTVRYSGQKLVCDDHRKWRDDENNEIVEASCIQNLYCHDTTAPIIDITCPTGMEDCEQIALPAPGSTNGAHLPLTCNSKKIFIKSKEGPDSQPWDELKSIQCDENTGKWKIEIEGKTLPHGETEEQRDHKNTLICRGDKNPPTTPTPPTIEPICTLCESQLPPFLDCNACSKNGTAGTRDFTLESNNKGAVATLADKCLITAVKGAKIVINGFQEIKDFIECSRKQPKRDPSKVEWKTRGGDRVDKFSARKEATQEGWKTLSYVIVGIAFITIGGMGIGFFVIYFRVRKQPKGKKNKERGVTKKYTSSNVVKTNQSNRSKEACKSKEPTGSKMSVQFEQAPNLKL